MLKISPWDSFVTAPLEAVGRYLREKIVLQRGRQAVEQLGLVFTRKMSNGLSQRSKGHIQILTGEAHFIKANCTLTSCFGPTRAERPYSARGRAIRSTRVEVICVFPDADIADFRFFC